MSYLYRCTGQYRTGPFRGKRCYQRHSFKKKVEEYARPKKCHCCGNKITYIDKWQMKKNKEATCDCGSPHYPHRKGTTVWCIYHPTGPTEDDYRNRR